MKARYDFYEEVEQAMSLRDFLQYLDKLEDIIIRDANLDSEERLALLRAITKVTGYVS